MHDQTRSITEGAMMCALVGLMLFLNRQLAGILEYAMYWILSFPILIYTVKYGWKKALIPAVAMLLLALMISVPTTLFYLASALLCGMIYGYGVKAGWPNLRLLIATGILTLLSYLITMVLFAGVFGYDPQEDILIAERLVEMLSVEGVNIAQIALIVPIMLSVTTAVLQTICVHLLAVMMLSRMHLPYPELKRIYECRMPKWIAWISICIWLLFSLKNVLKLEGTLLVICISAYVADLLVLCAQCVICALRLCTAMHQRRLAVISALAIILMLLWTPTRILIGCFGICSIVKENRRR